MADEADPRNNPIGTELVFEDESVRVWRIDLAPGEQAGWHTHYLDYTSIVVEGGRVERRARPRYNSARLAGAPAGGTSRTASPGEST